MERLQKLIAESGYCSRRKAEELIKQGKVILNGKKVTELGVKATFGDEILVEGNLIEYQEKEYTYNAKFRVYDRVEGISEEHRVLFIKTPDIVKMVFLV